jgi:hypothetical protein
MSNKQRTKSQRGMSIFIVAIGLTVLAGIAGLSIDLASLYVARNEAQRAADAAALAGAQEILSSGYPTGLVNASTAAGLAAPQAATVGNQNLVLGQNPNLNITNFGLASLVATGNNCPPPSGVSGGCFDFTTYSNDPRITVQVYKSMPTYFMKVFGITSVPISAQATAEVYTPSGGDGPATSTQCLKPWLLPNCDPFSPEVPSGSPLASLCQDTSSGMYYQYFVNPNDNDSVVRPGLTPTGVVGELLPIKTGSPSQAPAPSQFYPVFLPSNGTFVCPSCASSDQNASTSNSASLYRENIECCSTNQIACGSSTVDPISGNMVGPTGQGVDCLIHESANGTGMDYISLDSSLSIPFIMYAGSNNPYGFAAGTQITTSDSLITVPLYDGAALCPGSSCPTSVSVNIVGFMQMFIQKDDKKNNNTVDAYVINVSGCNGGSSSTGGGGTPVPVYDGLPIPVRLIHN